MNTIKKNQYSQSDCIEKAYIIHDPKFNNMIKKSLAKKTISLKSMLFLKSIAKAQMTIFMMLGFFVLLSIIVATIMIFNNQRVQTDAQDPLSFDASAIQQHVDVCISKIEKDIETLAQNGGEFNPAYTLNLQGLKYTYWCLQDNSKICKNRVMSKELFQEALEKLLPQKIYSCINLSSYERAGYSITRSSPLVVARIGKQDMSITYTEDILVSRVQESDEATNKPETLEFKEAYHLFKIPLGNMIDLSNDILNEEIISGTFDKDAWMKNHGATVLIEKHKMYPHTVYSLLQLSEETSSWINLRFAIEGYTTDGTGVFPILPVSSLPICKTDTGCFVNPSSECGVHYGNQTSGSCPIQSSLQNTVECSGGVCDGCGILYSHGQEWCESESSGVGNGIDFVGSRHYKKSCVDGVIFTEECRDYREEICAETGFSSGSKAICRPNRWQDCSVQSTESSCADSILRDCMWIGSFNKKNYKGNVVTGCVPNVPPGFRFWEGQGINICQDGNEWIDCDGMSCPASWPVQALNRCYKLGDCGAGYSVANVRSDFAFTVTDQRPLVDLSAVPNPSQYYGSSWNVAKNLSYSTRNNHTECTDCTITNLSDRVMQYIDYLESIEEDEVIADYLADGKIKYHTRHFAVCLPYRPEESNSAQFVTSCKSCGADPFKPCTEYKCKSIGRNCIYYEQNGFGICNEPSSVKSPPPEVLTATLTNLNGYPQINNVYLGYTGKYITHTLEPYTNLQISFNTTTKALCSISPLPVEMVPSMVSTYATYLDYSSRSFDTVFTYNHSAVISIAPTEFLLDDLQKINSMTSYIDVINIGMYTTKLNQLEKKIKDLGDKQDVNVEPAVKNIREINDYITTVVSPTMSQIKLVANGYVTVLLSSLSTNQGRNFISCVDESGLRSTQNVYISYLIGDDTKSPVLLSSPTVEKNSSYLFVNFSTSEPVLCKASFSLSSSTYLPAENFAIMPLQFSCSKNYYNPSAGFTCGLLLPPSTCGTSGISGAGVSTVPASTELYILCRDKPYEKNSSLANFNTNIDSVPVCS